MRFSRKLKIGMATMAAVGAMSALPMEASAACSTVPAESAGRLHHPRPAGGKAKLINGKAVAPRSAPRVVKAVIAAANRIEDRPYRYGGGHARWNDSGYDCSGSVSYALHGGGLLDSPMPSGSFMNWERARPRRWITVYANGGHAYAVIAGLRWDTSMTPGDGPGWSKQMRSSSGFRIRHPARLLARRQ